MIFAGLISVLVVLAAFWIIYCGFVVRELKVRKPDLYAKLGSPTGFKNWSGSFGSDELDDFILGRRFRAAGIDDAKLLRLLELAYWIRWLYFLSAIGVALGIFGSALTQNVT